MTDTRTQGAEGGAGVEDTAARDDWRGRLQGKLAAAADEHRDNANPEAAPASGRARRFRGGPGCG